MEPLKPTGKRARRLWIALAVVAAVVVWLGLDLYVPRQTNIRNFDPDEVARLETAMWRSYYSRQRVRLFAQLGELLRTQYHFPFFRFNAVAFHASF